MCLIPVPFAFGLEERLIVIIITTRDDFHYQAKVLKVRERQAAFKVYHKESCIFYFLNSLCSGESTEERSAGK